MGNKKNRRTLKKRIRKMMFLCMLISIILLGGIIIFLCAQFFKAQAVIISNYFSSSIAQDMNSDFFMKEHGITGLEAFNPASPKAAEWLNALKKSKEIPNVSYSMSHPLPKLDPHSPQAVKVIENLEKKHEGDDPPRFIDLRKMVYTRIELNHKLIYLSEDPRNGIFPLGPPDNQVADPSSQNKIFQMLLNFYSDTETAYPLLDSKGNIIGKVTTRINPEFLLVIFLSLAVIIILVSFLSLFIARIIGRFLVFPITAPLCQLEEKIKAVANEDYENNMEKQIVIKKPLREIESIADSTNLIIQRMKEYNNLLASQKIILENQNEELEAQNQELAESKKQIQEAQTLIVQTENLASIGQLTAATAHEINTPLGAINSNVQLCEMLIGLLDKNDAIKQNPDAADLIDQLKQANSVNTMACKRVIEIIKSLKTFSKVDTAEFQEADLIEGIKSALVLTSNLWKNKAVIHEEYGSLPAVRCFPGMLNQVFMNILVNAVHAIEDKGDIFIKTWSDDRYAYVSTRDTGTGISEEHLERIFDFGFSTKRSHTGMGLGLSICRNIIDKHKGEIKVETEPGKGTEFVICIPVNI